MPPAAEFVNGLLAAAVEFHEPWPPLWLLEWAGQSLLLTWLFAMGASVGSFLNVVVYRLPAGLNLVHPNSHCPRCLSPIRLRHNIPVFGWLLLRGRCRDCRLPISWRYPAVEFLIGSLFVAVAAVELYVPQPWATATLSPLLRPPLDPRDNPFWLAYSMHLLLLTTLVGASLIESDGKRVPMRLFLPALLVGLGLPTMWPEIRLMPAFPGSDWTDWRAGLVDGFAGLFAGVLLGAIARLAWWLGSARRAWPQFAPVSLLAALGAVVGWQQVAYALPQTLLLLLLCLLFVAARQAKGKRLIPGSSLFWLVAVWTVVVRPKLGALGDLEFIATRSADSPAVWFLSMIGCTAILAAGCGSIALPQEWEKPER